MLRAVIEAKETAFQALVATMSDQVAVVDAEWCILAQSDAWTELTRQLNFGALLTIGQNYKRACEWCSMSGISDADAILDGIHSIESGEETKFELDYRPRVLPGQTYRLTIASFEIAGLRYATISHVDLTEVADLRQERLRLEGQLMRAYAKIVRAQKEERHHIARELHDTAAQSLAAVTLGLSNLRRIASDAAVSTAVGETALLVDQFHRDLRGITFGLHPPELRDGGLHSAVRMLCSGFARRTGLQISVKIYGIEAAHSTAVEATIYRILQEALSNIHRHAQAVRVRVRLCERDACSFLIVEDDGVGLSDTRTNGGATIEYGVGIPGMMARVEELEGRFAIHRSPGGPGTVLAVGLPRFAKSFFVGDARDRISRGEGEGPALGRGAA